MRQIKKSLKIRFFLSHLRKVLFVLKDAFFRVSDIKNQTTENSHCLFSQTFFVAVHGNHLNEAKSKLVTTQQL